ncbi:MAG TPA: cell division protein FtsW, partial [Lachnospiraceae bacterium]|nr:cell division protein FtsW [Lachnospiraceae bacterium]
FFSICLILVCLSCFISFMKLAINFRNVYYRLITVGLAVVYMFQIFLTIGGGTRLIPLTGVTLPLISSGGSSILTTIILFSLIQGFNVLQAEEKERYEEEY